MITTIEDFLPKGFNTEQYRKETTACYHRCLKKYGLDPKDCEIRYPDFMDAHGLEALCPFDDELPDGLEAELFGIKMAIIYSL